jgi:hypothetical protein
MTTRKLLPFGMLLTLAVILGACTYPPNCPPTSYLGPIATDPGPSGYTDPSGYPYPNGIPDRTESTLDNVNVGYGEYDPSLGYWIWFGPIPRYGNPFWWNYYQGFMLHGWYDRDRGQWHNGHGGWGNGPAPGGFRGPGGPVFAPPPVRGPMPGRPPIEGPGFGRQPVSGGFGRQPGGEPSGGMRGRRVFVPRS